MEYIVETIEKPDMIKVESAVVFSYPAHIHTYSEMILYEPFEGTVIVNDLHIPADRGCAVLIAPSDLHRILVTQSRQARFLKIDFTSRKANHSVLLRTPGEEPLLSAVFAEIRKGENSDAFVNLLVQTAACILLEKGEVIPSLKKTAPNDLAIQAVRIIKDRAQESLTLASVAESLFVSAPYLSKVFKETIGIGFSDYLIRTRLDRAAELLRKTDRSVTEICMESGFHNLSHFIRSFRRRFGCSPSVFCANRENRRQ